MWEGRFGVWRTTLGTCQWLTAALNPRIVIAGHAAAVFKDRLWVVGGRGELYQTYNLRFQNRRGDVWSSSDGQTWLQSNDLTGEFHLQNFDAINPGSLAPWYARFGHTLNVLQATNHSGMVTELMVLAGGYTPDPDNDVWVTEDGSESLFAPGKHPKIWGCFVGSQCNKV